MEEFFYTTHYPHRWTSGPTVHTHNLDTLAPIKSLEEAKALAEKKATYARGTDDRCVTTYGVQYKVKENYDA